MTILLDTNVLMRLSDIDDAKRVLAVEAIDTARTRGAPLHIVPQTIYEFWTAATRTRAANGLGLPAGDVLAAIETYVRKFTFLPDTPDVYPHFIDLMRRYEVAGTNAYDGRLVAAMQTHGLTELMTFNARDFRRYDEVTLIEL